MNIQEETKAFLEKSGWTQIKLAEELGMHPTTLSRIINNPEEPKTASGKLLVFLMTKSSDEKKKTNA